METKPKNYSQLVKTKSKKSDLPQRKTHTHTQ